ncbi:MAG: ferrous iron transporter B [Christensenellaceae bacterium]|jgi:ferrous iron transport protein B|nr:ferrous iron transporter B [Christensenellaceae bacterium]
MSTIALMGNPNVGKSTVFNQLTGLRQHTGNWPGKTVASARGRCIRGGRDYMVVDLPGAYSLLAHSQEEEIARDFILSGEADAIIIVCDATCLERNLSLVLQTLRLTGRVAVCVNLMDEAQKKHIRVDVAALERELGVPVVGCAARGGKGMDALLHAAERAMAGQMLAPLPMEEQSAAQIYAEAARIAGACVQTGDMAYKEKQRRLDALLTGRALGLPIMLLLLAGALWVTIAGANYPSALLMRALFAFEGVLAAALGGTGAPGWLNGLLTAGVYRVLAWVVSVMLPPMAIFFPLFTLLEDVGYLPRVAFNLDHSFKRCHACGKQALTMCMGLGCNAAGVTGCRIIDSPRERLIAILTNAFVPCNGRFPIMTSVIGMFFVGTGAAWAGAGLGALLLTGVIVLGVGFTLLASRLLSATLLKGVPSSFTLEMPPYRMPQVGRVLVRSMLDRTLFVLGRAVAVAAPAGLLIWGMANLSVGGVTLLARCAALLNPLGRLMGLDGVILLAFILGLPANEIVVPIMIMAYLQSGALVEMHSLLALKDLLLSHGWTWVTAVCTVLFSLLHWPCSTTLLTIKKETGSYKWAALALALPTVCGVGLCMLVAGAARLMGA